ncbi:hypothetical protein F4859DRAFT_252026 [Xylaria cf. heliscus]|nr:hypothetical protein F4859DRAFT_252026 [Xylaria cf. heliscus]
MKATTLPKEKPDSMVSNTTCVYIKDLSRCALTMALAPQMTFDVPQKGRTCLVTLFCVCAYKRWMRWDEGEWSGLATCRLNELCFLLVIMEDKDGIHNCLVVRVVYQQE